MHDPATWTLIGLLGAFAASTVAVVLFAMTTAFRRFDDRFEALQRGLDVRFTAIEHRLEGIEGRLDRLERRQLT
jgi:hypothetical protein